MNRKLAWILLACAPLGACASNTAEPREETAYESLKASMEDLKAAQKRFTAANEAPKTLDFGGNGKVTIRQLSLDGYPGNTYVRCRFHFQNDTGRPVLRSLVSLDVLDADGELVASQMSVCIFPTPRAIHDGTFFADELRTQTHDAHVREGWTWRLTCKTEFMDEGDAKDN
jgi:hypothetical protein